MKRHKSLSLLRVSKSDHFFLPFPSLLLIFVFTSSGSPLPRLSPFLFQITGVTKCPQIIPGNCWKQGVISENWELQSNQNKPITYWPIYDLLSLLFSRHQLKDSDQTKNVNIAKTTGPTAQARRLIFGQHKIYFPSLNTMYIATGWIFSMGTGWCGRSEHIVNCQSSNLSSATTNSRNLNIILCVQLWFSC